MKGGRLIGTYPIKVVLAGGIIGFIITTISFKNVKAKITKKDMNCSLKIQIDNNEKFIKAIIDTGNFLKEPITKTPVIVVEKDALRDLVPEYIINNSEKIIKGEDFEIQEYASRIRIIPFSSLGKQNGILLGVKGDLLIVNLEEKDIYIKNFIIGIYDGVLSKSGKYQALIGLEILEETGGEVNEHSEFIKM
ncbi:MAG: sigma-E processing peptidase SpoIIGA [Clostridia bacterium]|nr:sigma-E processing peptidase SpoIIGA [Clostridia bacterium]